LSLFTANVCVQVFFWVPTILYLGVRPASLLACLIILACCIWGGLSTSLASLEASRIVATWAACLGEVLPGIIVRDIFFLHERGKWMGVYLIFFQSFPSLGVLIAGWIITAGGWRWYYWVQHSMFRTNAVYDDCCVCIVGIALLLCPGNAVPANRPDSAPPNRRSVSISK
jgi:MFS family permease